MSLMGIDVGTTGCKAVAFDLEGKILSSAYREYPLHSPQPGWAELDGNRVWEDIKTCIQQVASETTQDPITALAVSCQGEAVSPVDQAGNILHNALVSFADGTYFELIAFREPDRPQEHRWWPRLAQGEGLVDYALASDNLPGDASQIRAGGLQVVGPSDGGRVRPAGAPTARRLAPPGLSRIRATAVP